MQQRPDPGKKKKKMQGAFLPLRDTGIGEQFTFFGNLSWEQDMKGVYGRDNPVCTD